MKHLIKRTLLFTIPLILSACIFDSNDDDEAEPWNAEAVCPAEGNNIYGMPNRGSFTDERDGQVYKYTTIGDQVWMAENLRYAAPYSTCSNDTNFVEQYCKLIELNCKTETCCKESLCHHFGRYYTIIENGKWMGNIDIDLADTICPKGWHIPQKHEWERLEKKMIMPGENKTNAASRMKSSDSSFFAMSSTQINELNRTYVGTDDCSLSILPSGFMYEGGMTLEFNASLLSSTQEDSHFISTYRIGNKSSFEIQNYRDAIRCVMDPVNPEL